MIYLDHNATTPIDPRVAESIAECYAAGYLNPASSHAAGRRARQRLEQARSSVAHILGAGTTGVSSAEVIFTSGGTESNNLAIRGLAGPSTTPNGARARIIVSAIEHPSILDTARHLWTRGYDVRQMPVDRNGVVLVGQLDELINHETRLVSVMLANNETGVIQPLAEITAICHDRGVIVHTDAVQMVGKLPIDFDALGVDAMSLSAHKFHGPTGIGALLLRSGLKLDPLFFGGFQQQTWRPGTESVVLAVGLQRALEIWQQESPARGKRMQSLRDELESMLQSGCADMVVNGGSVSRLPHCSNVSFPGCDRQAMLIAVDQFGLCCSTGSACASGSSEPSPVLKAMGCSDAIVEGSLRISLGATTTITEIVQAAQIILENMAKISRGNQAF